MSETVLKRTCMRDRIRDVLVERILDGTYPAGTQLKELILAREFNVSQAPIPFSARNARPSTYRLDSRPAQGGIASAP